MYVRLVRMHREEGLSFRNVAAFHMDEYVGLPPEDPGSYRSYMRSRLFDLVDLPPESARLVDGTARIPRPRPMRTSGQSPTRGVSGSSWAA